MQTFLPSPNFQRSAEVLDRQRLGKQRVETMQIMSALVWGAGWGNHPATLMWQGHECALMKYQLAICTEWVERGYKDTCLEKTQRMHDHKCCAHPTMPWWMGDAGFHKGHQSNLLRKDLAFYRPQFDLRVPDNLPYLWPTPELTFRTIP